ncbi:hypothetical protein OIU74_012686 [Salix koriyanagi]|uniref:Uncharacterized protein n=1 Tax=Salix koriyanagi TaxID=2511006 RepID=A0A9Q0T4T2_9ROSI|nr:hypothetical protein OIU74_012686 [Salix koriyanagi]
MGWKWRSWIRRRRLVAWGGSLGVPGGSLSIDWPWRETRLGSIGVCYKLWGEIANAEECVQQDSRFCEEVSREGLEEERDCG